MSVEVTVAICSRNRAASLARALDSICRLEIPENTQWEVIVVDNGSTDATAQVLRDFSDRLPLRILFDPIPGVSRARNCAMREARGRYICWTDDDVEVGRGWLAAYLRAFERHPEAALFGGPITPVLEPPARPLFERGKNRWPLSAPYAVRAPGPGERPLCLRNSDVPYGANLAVRTAEQRQFPFDERLGPSPHFSRLADEIDVIYRMMKQGALGWWVPDALVDHVIPAERQTLGYLFFYYKRIGETAVWLHENMPGDNINEIEGPPAFALSGSLRHLPGKLAKILQTIAMRTGWRDDRWLGFLALFAYAVGILGHRRVARVERTKLATRTLGKAERR